MTYVYAFDQSHGFSHEEAKALLGGKAAGLSIMATELHLPVPPGFTITTAACNAYLSGGWPEGLDDEIRAHVKRVEDLVGRRFGDASDPLLVSVRSGAPVSMPGMMDTILNLGLNDATARGLAAVSGDPAFAANCHERFRKMFMEIVGVDSVPDDPWAQLRAAAEAVFRSWNGDRARTYRKIEGIPDDLGTAVTIQTMVFGNRGADSATGVLFTRNAATGEPKLYGDLMFNAQGEDVVAGTHKTETMDVLDERLPAVAAELRRYATDLEHHYADLCDIEFTVERGKLWMLQVRVGKRTPQAALRMAIDMADADGFPLDRKAAVERVARYLADPPKVSVLRVDQAAALTRGLAASPGVAAGEIVTSPDAAEELADAGKQVILVRAETSPDDVHGMAKAAGLLTSTGGFVSHAAVVARGWGIPAVVGASQIAVGDGFVTIAGRRFEAGETITIDGATGGVFEGEVCGAAEIVPEAATLLSWAHDLGIRIEDNNGSGPHGGADGTGGGEPQADAAITCDDLVRGLWVKGLSTEEGLASSLLADVPTVQGLLPQVIQAGLVETTAGAYRLTGEGKLKGAELMAAERERWGSCNADEALDEFIPFDHRMKETVTAWQVRGVNGEQVPNDHADPEYDVQVIATLIALHEDVAAWLEGLSTGLGRLAAYNTRLGRALSMARGGDQRYVASPRVESYHTVWFELHEDLIKLSGRKRSEEVAAGRA